jgi:hypothetical protein
MQIKSCLERNLPVESMTQASRQIVPSGLGVASGRSMFSTGLPTLEDGSMIIGPNSSIRSEHYGSHTSNGTDLTHGVYPGRDTANVRKYTVGGLALVGVIALVVVALRPWSKEATVAPATTAQEASVQEAAPKVGTLSITSDPPEATVNWDSRVLGKTPLRVDLPMGSQNIVVSKPGFFDETLIVTISQAALLERALTLRTKPDTSASLAAASAKAGSTDSGSRHRPVRGVPPRGAAPPPRSTEPPPIMAAPEPPPPAKTVKPAKPGIQILDEGSKPAVKVDVVQ